jgi:hypothetical protein
MKSAMSESSTFLDRRRSDDFSDVSNADDRAQSTDRLLRSPVMNSTILSSEYCSIGFVIHPVDLLKWKMYRAPTQNEILDQPSNATSSTGLLSLFCLMTVNVTPETQHLLALAVTSANGLLTLFSPTPHSSAKRSPPLSPI